MHRKMSQQDLADQIGTLQSSISRMEDPDYGRHSLDTLVKVANAFDCALLVKLIPYSVLAQESEDLSPAALYAAPYSVERITTLENHDQVENIPYQIER